ADGCGPVSPCDEAIVQDCSDVAGILSDGYLRAATACVEASGSWASCALSATSELAPTEAHRAFAKAFCSECALGVPGCEEAFFDAEDPDLALVGSLMLPLGDELVAEIGSECATGITCLATFSSCVQG